MSEGCFLVLALHAPITDERWDPWEIIEREYLGGLSEVGLVFPYIARRGEDVYFRATLERMQRQAAARAGRHAGKEG